MSDEAVGHLVATVVVVVVIVVRVVIVVHQFRERGRQLRPGG
jgi:hypothetical protein